MSLYPVAAAQAPLSRTDDGFPVDGVSPVYYIFSRAPDPAAPNGL
jgi:hypothetical protein